MTFKESCQKVRHICKTQKHPPLGTYNTGDLFQTNCNIFVQLGKKQKHWESSFCKHRLYLLVTSQDTRIPNIISSPWHTAKNPCPLAWAPMDGCYLSLGLGRGRAWELLIPNCTL